MIISPADAELYTPSQKAIELVRSTKILLLVGIAGAGKDTLKHELLRDPRFKDLVSHTTRQPRINNNVAEIDGDDYYFIDETTAATMMRQQQFVEVKYVHGTIYGTSVQELQSAHTENRIAVTDIDVQGVAEYKELSQDVRAIFVLPPDYQTWIDRLSHRYASVEAFEAEWPKRQASARKELRHALDCDYYQFVVNDTLATAVEAVIALDENPSLQTDDQIEAAKNVARTLLATIEAQD